MSWLLIGICVSELLAIYLIFKLWKSSDLIFLKFCFSAIALIPFLGPFFVLWGANFPAVQHPAFQDREKYRGDVFDRWRSILSEKNPHTRFRIWQQMLEKKDVEQP